MTTEAWWTIDELAQLVGEALAVDYAGQTNGRVRDVPDRRTIRWYTTIGLLDRPAAMRGRTALYGQRHLLQLVAVKRLQADGRTIAEVQQALLGANDATLDQLAQLPNLQATPPKPSPAAPPATPRRPAHPAAPPMASPAAPPATQPAAPPATQPTAPPAAPAPPATRSSAPPATPAAAPVAPTPPAPSPAAAPSARSASSPAAAQPARFWAARPASAKPAPSAAIVPSVRLADGVTLVLDGARPLTEDDLAAIAEAATALLNVLHDRGLTAPTAAPTSRGSQA